MTTDHTIAERLHDDMHRIPGMPSHDRAAELNSNARAASNHDHTSTHASAPGQPSQRNRNRQHGEPKVLVEWQHFIGRLFGRD